MLDLAWILSCQQAQSLIMHALHRCCAIRVCSSAQRDWCWFVWIRGSWLVFTRCWWFCLGARRKESAQHSVSYQRLVICWNIPLQHHLNLHFYWHLQCMRTPRQVCAAFLLDINSYSCVAETSECEWMLIWIVYRSVREGCLVGLLLDPATNSVRFSCNGDVIHSLQMPKDWDVTDSMRGYSSTGLNFAIDFGVRAQIVTLPLTR
jgi:hypothetical protein